MELGGEVVPHPGELLRQVPAGSCIEGENPLRILPLRVACIHVYLRLLERYSLPIDAWILL